MAIAIDFDAEGRAREYRLVSERNPEFLKKYPLAEGWQVRKELLDPLAATGLKDLYIEAIRAGKKPVDAGLPLLEMMALVRCSLISPQNIVVAEAHALQPINEFKDFEKGETAAVQRLLAAAGFGGEVFDDDEARTIKQMGGKIVTAPTPNESTAASTSTAPAAEAKQETPVSSTPSEVKAVVEEPKPATPIPEPAAAAKAPIAESAVVTPIRAGTRRAPDTPAGPDDPPTKAQLTNLESWCKKKGVDYVEPKTQAEASAKLAEVLQKKTQKA